MKNLISRTINPVEQQDLQLPGDFHMLDVHSEIYPISQTTEPPRERLILSYLGTPDMDKVSVRLVIKTAGSAVEPSDGQHLATVVVQQRKALHIFWCVSPAATP